MAKYILGTSMSQMTGSEIKAEIEMTDEEYERYENGDEEMEAHVRGLAHDQAGFDFWIEKKED